jgi:hypothetical protein
VDYTSDFSSAVVKEICDCLVNIQWGFEEREVSTFIKFGKKRPLGKLKTRASCSIPLGIGLCPIKPVEQKVLPYLSSIDNNLCEWSNG